MQAKQTSSSDKDKEDLNQQSCVCEAGEKNGLEIQDVNDEVQVEIFFDPGIEFLMLA